MIIKKCVCKNFKMESTSEIEEFISQNLNTHNVTDMKQTAYTIRKTAYMNIVIIYTEEVLDDNDKVYLKEIIKFNQISINYTTCKLPVGFNRAKYLIDILGKSKIISDAASGRKLLMSVDEANKIIDSLEI